MTELRRLGEGRSIFEASRREEETIRGNAPQQSADVGSRRCQQGGVNETKDNCLLGLPESKPTTVKNPQANSIIERIHQVIANMIRTQDLLENPISSLQHMEQCLNHVQWASNATIHSTLKASPAQLAFGRDMIMPTPYLANWSLLHHRHQKRAFADNARENSHRIPYEYRVGDQVLIRNELRNLGKLAAPTSGPFRLIEVKFVIDRGHSTERINVRRLLPFLQPHH